MRLIDEIASGYLGGAVVTILPDTLAQTSDRVILAGSRAILLSPFTTENLIVTLNRVYQLTSRTTGTLPSGKTTSQQARKSRSLVVFSPKGGVGCTSIAINLAISFRQQLEEEVLLIDGKRNLGHIGLMLNLRTGNSILDLLPHVNKLDEAIIRQVAVPHVSGVSIITSPASIERSQETKPEDIYKIFNNFKAIYPNIIVDGGNYLDENLVTYMDMADCILLVINPSLAAIRDARQFINFCRTLSYSEKKILLVINQAGHKADVKIQDIEKVLHTKVLGVIPADEDLMLSCLNEGVPVVSKKPNHPISKSIKALVKNLLTNMVSQANLTPIDSDLSSDVLRKSSYLG